MNIFKYIQIKLDLIQFDENRLNDIKFDLLWPPYFGPDPALGTSRIEYWEPGLAHGGGPISKFGKIYQNMYEIQTISMYQHMYNMFGKIYKKMYKTKFFRWQVGESLATLTNNQQKISICFVTWHDIYFNLITFHQFQFDSTKNNNFSICRLNLIWIHNIFGITAHLHGWLSHQLGPTARLTIRPARGDPSMWKVARCSRPSRWVMARTTSQCCRLQNNVKQL